MLSKIRSYLSSIGAGVKTFKNQADVIPGLQTPNHQGNGKPPKRSAIMRAVPMKMNGHLKSASAMQEMQYEKREEKIADENEERIKKGNKDDILVAIHTSVGKLQASLAKFNQEWKASGKGFGYEYINAKNQHEQ